MTLAISTMALAQSNEGGATPRNPIHKWKTDTMKIKQTVGFAIDLLPPILSAATGNFGYSGQVWYGYRKIRVRAVIADFYMPDKLMGNSDFQDLHTTATALIFDYFKNYNFKGWWVGAGVELWNNKITSKSDYNTYNYKDYVATAGLGYIIKVYKNFYVEPWGAVHYVLSNQSVSVSTTEYKTKMFQGEVSVKIGWHF
ncbi:hypothetical protein BH10PSE19_BH10PSE19_19050 [soil metagenome]